MALLLSGKDVADLLTVEDAITAVEEAFRQLALGQVTMPQRTAIRLPEHRGLQLGMPAHVAKRIGGFSKKHRIVVLARWRSHDSGREKHE